jgi:hypothetical protein
MRAFVVAVVMVAASWAQAHAAPVDNAATAVRAAVQRYDEGWRTYDVDKVANAFAASFEWTNEVGLRFED